MLGEHARHPWDHLAQGDRTLLVPYTFAGSQFFNFLDTQIQQQGQNRHILTVKYSEHLHIHSERHREPMGIREDAQLEQTQHSRTHCRPESYHVYIVPSEDSASECQPPAEMSATETSSSPTVIDGSVAYVVSPVPSCPKSFVPHARTRFDEFRARL